jgi:hypothetical protein
LLTSVKEYEDVENLFPDFSGCEGGIIEDRAISAPAILNPIPLTQLSMGTSMPDLMPAAEWCNDYGDQQQRPSSASRATTYMVPVEKDVWRQPGSCQKRQRNEEEEEEEEEGSSKRRKH